MKNNVLKRFKFALQKNIDFNYEIIINVIYLIKRLVLHIINVTIAF